MRLAFFMTCIVGIVAVTALVALAMHLGLPVEVETSTGTLKTEPQRPVEPLKSQHHGPLK